MPFLRRFASAPQAVASAVDPLVHAPADPARRRALRVFGAGAVALAAASFARPASAASGAARELAFHNTHTGESLRVAFCRGGEYCTDGLARIARVLRDHRTGDVHPIDPALLDQLYDVAARCDREPEFEVISGYRSPRTNAMLNARSNGVARRSLHMDGKAIDVRLVGYDLARLRDAALQLERGGVGYYRASQFVHLDTGRVRAWAG